MPKLLQTCPLRRATDGDNHNQWFPATDSASITLAFFMSQVTGDLSDTRTRYIGSRPVKLFRVNMQGGEAVLAMSSRTWEGAFGLSSIGLIRDRDKADLRFQGGFLAESAVFAFQQNLISHQFCQFCLIPKRNFLFVINQSYRVSKTKWYNLDS